MEKLQAAIALGQLPDEKHFVLGELIQSDGTYVQQEGTYWDFKSKAHNCLRHDRRG